MAGALIGGAFLGDAVSKSSDLIIYVIKTTWYFKSQLNAMRKTVDSTRPIAEQLDRLNEQLDRPKEEIERFTHLLNQADELVLKCANVKWNIWKIISHASKLDDLNKSLRDFVQFNLQLQSARHGAETLLGVRSLIKGRCLSGWSSGALLQKDGVVGFDDRVRDLKAMMLMDSVGDDCLIVVVSAAGGSGKTTFVKLFCNDPEIQERFGGSIYFVTVSQSYNSKFIITKLLGDLPSNTNDEEAIQQWGSFVGGNESEILLVLDDVWSDSVIKDFKFKSPGYKVLVTSRITFTQFKTYQLQVLNNQDAAHLFRSSVGQVLQESSTAP